MSWNTILFDLDGTLTDPKVGITTAVSKGLAHFGITEDPENLTNFIGPPLHESFQVYYGMTPEQAVKAVEVFREYYNRQGWAENVPYAGVSECLKALKDSGKKLLVATSKPENFAERILEHFGMAQYFDLICGAPIHDPAGSKKATVILDALARADVRDLSDAIMVGDRKHDVLGAHEVGLKAVGVLYGYGSREEFLACGADYIVENVEQLQEYLLNK